MHLRDDELVELVRDLGLPATTVLGSGIEGTVLDLADGSVLKVWSRRTGDELQLLRGFYDSVAGAGLPFGVPQILEVRRVGGRYATVQVRLEGQPLWEQPGVSPPLDDEDVEAVITVLAALAAVQSAPEMAVLPVLEGEAAFDPGTSFERSLADLVEARALRHRGPLRARVRDLDHVVSVVTHRLRHLPFASPSLVHGDLVPGNILVSSGAPVGVLDFGFLSTVGDPAFDAAVTASIYDMYGPDAARTESRLDEAVSGRFDYPRARLLLYRAAYALITANCFSASGSDGHFDWCVRMLERPEVREVLDS